MPVLQRRAIVLLLLAFFVTGACVMAFVRPPHEDEGHFANAAGEFMRNGRLAMPMWTEWVASLDRCMFVTMPLYFISLSFWARMFGESIAVLRLFSVVCGIALVLSWLGILRRLAPDGLTPLLGFALIAGNYDIMNTASGRYDPYVAAFNALGLFLYLHWRESHLARAVFAGNACLALACVTHPYALFGMAGFAVFFLFLDRDRFTFRLAALAAVPYLVTFGVWGLYIAQYPDEFRTQMAANASGRMRYLLHPVDALWSDLMQRYITGFSGFRPDVPVYMRVKILLLIAYAAGFAVCVLTGAIRRNAKLAALLAYAGICYAILAFLDGTRWYIYLIHALPAYSAVLAVALSHLYRTYSLTRAPVIAVAALLLLYSATTVAYRARNNEYAKVYEPTLRFLQSNVRPGEIVMGGSGEFGPGLGYREHVLVDYRLGYLNRKTPDVIVADKELRDYIRVTERTDPAVHRHLVSVMSGYEVVFASSDGANAYQVYRRRTGAEKSGL